MFKKDKGTTQIKGSASAGCIKTNTTKELINQVVTKNSKPTPVPTPSTPAPMPKETTQNEQIKIPTTVKVGSIGYCSNKVLGILQDDEKRKNEGHYVYISKVNKDGICNVNIITSLERSKYDFFNNRIKYARDSKTYAIPFKDSDFTKWSGIKKETLKNVSLSNIKDIGRHSITNEHLAIIDRFLK